MYLRGKVTELHGFGHILVYVYLHAQCTECLHIARSVCSKHMSRENRMFSGQKYMLIFKIKVSTNLREIRRTKGFRCSLVTRLTARATLMVRRSLVGPFLFTLPKFRELRP